LSTRLDCPDYFWVSAKAAEGFSLTCGRWLISPCSIRLYDLSAIGEGHVNQPVGFIKGSLKVVTEWHLAIAHLIGFETEVVAAKFVDQDSGAAITIKPTGAAREEVLVLAGLHPSQPTDAEDFFGDAEFPEKVNFAEDGAEVIKRHWPAEHFGALSRFEFVHPLGGFEQAVPLEVKIWR